MSTEMANRIIRYNVAVMTRRYRMDMINNEHQLQQVDIATNLRLERFKTRLGSSVRATLGGTLNEQAFQSALGFTPRTTVGAAADTLKQAFDGAWSPRGCSKRTLTGGMEMRGPAYRTAGNTDIVLRREPSQYARIGFDGCRLDGEHGSGWLLSCRVEAR